MDPANPWVGDIVRIDLSYVSEPLDDLNWENEWQIDLVPDSGFATFQSAEAPTWVKMMWDEPGTYGVSVLPQAVYCSHSGNSGLGFPSGTITYSTYGDKVETTVTVRSSGATRDIASANSIVYVVNDISLAIIDASDPPSPTILGAISTPGNAAGVAVLGNYAYVADGSSGIHIVDVSNPSTPAIVSTYDTLGYARAVAASLSCLTVADSEGGLCILDVSDPSKPSLLSKPDLGNVYDVAVVSMSLYVAGGNRLTILDISDPQDPVLLGDHWSSLFARGVAISGNYAFLAGSHSYPEYVSSYGNIRLGYSCLTIFDISDPSAPTIVSPFDHLKPKYTRGIAAGASRVYIANGVDGLSVFDVSNSSAPVEVSTLDTGGFVRDVSIAGDLAFIASNNEVHVANLVTRGSPVLVGSVSLD